MKIEVRNTVIEIDKIIRQSSWFDFKVISYDYSKLVVAGGIDLIYGHTLEIIFEDVFFIAGVFQTWHSITNSPVFFLPDNEYELNIKFEIEKDYQLFILKTEDYENDFVVAAKNVSYGTDTVYYYNRTELKENERIADFIKNKD